MWTTAYKRSKSPDCMLFWNIEKNVIRNDCVLSQKLILINDLPSKVMLFDAESTKMALIVCPVNIQMTQNFEHDVNMNIFEDQTSWTTEQDIIQKKVPRLIVWDVVYNWIVMRCEMATCNSNCFQIFLNLKSFQDINELSNISNMHASHIHNNYQNTISTRHEKPEICWSIKFLGNDFSHLLTRQDENLNLINLRQLNFLSV